MLRVVRMVVVIGEWETMGTAVRYIEGVLGFTSVFWAFGGGVFLIYVSALHPPSPPSKGEWRILPLRGDQEGC